MYSAKRGWKVITSGRLYNLFSEVVNHAKAIGLWKRELPLLCTRKSYGTAGSCFRRKNPQGLYDCAIVISEFILDMSDDQLRKILCHEVAHAICPLEKHSQVWLNTANQLGKRWGYVAEKYNTDGDIINALKAGKGNHKYEVYCPTCGAVWQYKTLNKTVRNPSHYKCGKCCTLLKAREL